MISLNEKYDADAITPGILCPVPSTVITNELLADWKVLRRNGKHD